MDLLQDDQQLRRRFREGERDALVAVYDHYAPQLIAKLRPGIRYWRQGRAQRVGRDDPRLEFEDIIQQTFLQAFEEAARLRYAGTGPYLHYLLSIARNVALQALRRREIPAEEVELAATASRAGGENASFDDPSWEIQRHEIEKLARDFVDSLSGQERRIFESRFIEKRPRTEVMADLKLTEMRARYREKKVLGRFVKHLRKHGYLAQ